MAKKEDSFSEKVDNISGTIFAAVLGVILICSFAIPTILGSAGLGALTESQAETYGGLIGVVVIVLIIGILLPIIKGYNNKR